MYITQRANRTPDSYTALEILPMNLRSWNIFGTKYDKGKLDKDHVNNPPNKEKIQQTEIKNAIINYAMDEILRVRQCLAGQC